MSVFPALPSVDRRLFIPEDIWVVRDGKLTPLSRADDPAGWEREVTANDAVTTRLKDNRWPVSSSSAPWLMAQMIRALRLAPGMRVLEVGTGTGYNAACLAALGADVVSVEIDPGVAGQARAALQAAGYSGVEVITGDGERGVPARAPFDRVIVTAAAHTIAYPWVEQTRNGGLIVVPYTGEGHAGALLVLTVNDGVASGQAEGEARFMPLHGQRLSQAVMNNIASQPGLRVTVTASGQEVTAGQPSRPGSRAG